ncbi:MAG: hypothetical protein ACKVUT_10275 [Gaiella sp.]
MSTAFDAPLERRRPRRTASTTSGPQAIPERRESVDQGRRLLSGGVLWIGVMTTLLAGVVAVNVVVLQLNMRHDRLGRERAELKVENARLQAQLSGSSASVQVATTAVAQGLVQADPLATEYVWLDREAGR